MRAEPRGIQRRIETSIKLVGSNLVGLRELKLHNAKLSGSILTNAGAMSNEAWIQLTAAKDLPRGPYEISVIGTGGESGTLKIHVDSLPQIMEQSTNVVESLPINVWGTFDPMGDITIPANRGLSLRYSRARANVQPNPPGFFYSPSTNTVDMIAFYRLQA